MELAIWSEVCYNIYDEQETTKQGFYGGIMRDFETTKQETIFALKHEICDVSSDSHIGDNTFVRFEIFDTIKNLCYKNYIPIGFCRYPAYGFGNGVAFIMQEIETCNEIWVHIPTTMWKQWLKQIEEIK